MLLYNVCCTYAQLGMPDDALTALDHAVEKGWGDKNWLEHDSDLDSIRDTPRYRGSCRPCDTTRGNHRLIHSRRSVLLFCAAQLLLSGCAASFQAPPKAGYFPPRGAWQRISPSAAGMDSVKLAEAIEFAMGRESTWDFGRDQVRTFGRPLGPLPESRARTSGMVIRHGYVVATFGDIKASDPVYSVAKSFLSTVAGLAVDRGLIRNVTDPVAGYIRDGGYDSPHNRLITWKNHLQQESEWEGSIWGKNSDFVGAAEFGAGERKPRPIQSPGEFYEYNDAPNKSLLAFTTASLQCAASGSAEVWHHGPDWCIVRLALGSVR